jgi:hypothetical protein
MRAACLQLPDPNHRSVVSMSCTRIPLKEQTEPAQMHMTGEHASDLRCMSESARQQLVGTAFACRSKIVEPTSVQISDRRWTRTGRRLPGRRGDTVATGLQTYELSHCESSAKSSAALPNRSASVSRSLSKSALYTSKVIDAGKSALDQPQDAGGM